MTRVLARREAGERGRKVTLHKGNCQLSSHSEQLRHGRRRPRSSVIDRQAGVESCGGACVGACASTCASALKVTCKAYERYITRSLSGSRHTLPSARKSLEAVKKLLWPMETPSSAAAAAREIPAHLQCHCGGNLATAVRCMTQTSFGQASVVVLARQPWMACLSLS